MGITESIMNNADSKPTKDDMIKDIDQEIEKTICNLKNCKSNTIESTILTEHKRHIEELKIKLLAFYESHQINNKLISTVNSKNVNVPNILDRYKNEIYKLQKENERFKTDCAEMKIKLKSANTALSSERTKYEIMAQKCNKSREGDLKKIEALENDLKEEKKVKQKLMKEFDEKEVQKNKEILKLVKDINHKANELNKMKYELDALKKENDSQKDLVVVEAKIAELLNEVGKLKKLEEDLINCQNSLEEEKKAKEDISNQLAVIQGLNKALEIEKVEYISQILNYNSEINQLNDKLNEMKKQLQKEEMISYISKGKGEISMSFLENGTPEEANQQDNLKIRCKNKNRKSQCWAYFNKEVAAKELDQGTGELAFKGDITQIMRHVIAMKANEMKPHGYYGLNDDNTQIPDNTMLKMHCFGNSLRDLNALRRISEPANFTAVEQLRDDLKNELDASQSHEKREEDTYREKIKKLIVFNKMLQLKLRNTRKNYKYQETLRREIQTTASLLEKLRDVKSVQDNSRNGLNSQMLSPQEEMQILETVKRRCDYLERELKATQVVGEGNILKYEKPIDATTSSLLYSSEENEQQTISRDDLEKYVSWLEGKVGNLKEGCHEKKIRQKSKDELELKRLKRNKEIIKYTQEIYELNKVKRDPKETENR